MRLSCAFAALTLLVAGSALAAPASTDPTVDIQLFHPTAGANNFFSTESGLVNSHLDVNVGLYLNWAHQPLAVQIVKEDDSRESVGAYVGDRLDPVLVASIGLFDIVELGLAMPGVLQGGSAADQFQGAGLSLETESLETFTQGDLRLIPKVQAFSVADGLLSAALVGTVILPTAGGSPYAGENNYVIAPSLAVSMNVAMLRAGLNVGYRYRDRTRVEEGGLTLLVVDDEVFAKLAVAIDLFQDPGAPFELVGEAYGHTPAVNAFAIDSSGFDKEQQLSRTVLEGIVGVRMVLADSLLMTAGAGGGMTQQGYGQAKPRVFVGLTYYTGRFGEADGDKDGVADSVDQCPERKEDRDGFQDEDGCPDDDNDEDGVVDEDDQCPNEPEGKRDGFNDEDGCPDPDNDEDGLLDEVDKCPNAAEDKDGFQDEDGCPDLDNDGDGVADKVDKCPEAPEDVDGFQDVDGCPDEDNDGDGLPDLGDLCPNHAEDKDGVADDDGCPEDNDNDGIPDVDDKCPNKAEIYNGIEDEDGCPEKVRARSLVKVTDEKIEIKQKVFFKTGSAKILSKSYNLLDQVASVLKNYKHIKKVRVEGHTDSRGSRRRNMKLSRDRARSVRDYLVGKGVAADRLEAEGYGPDKPIASNRTRRGREQNRRVEFVIVEQKPIGEDVTESEPVIDMQLEQAPGAPGDQEPTFDLEEIPTAPSPSDDSGIDFDLGGDKTPAEPDTKTKKKKEEQKDSESGDDIQFDF